MLSDIDTLHYEEHQEFFSIRLMKMLMQNGNLKNILHKAVSSPKNK